AVRLLRTRSWPTYSAPASRAKKNSPPSLRDEEVFGSELNEEKKEEPARESVGSSRLFQERPLTRARGAAPGFSGRRSRLPLRPKERLVTRGPRALPAGSRPPPGGRIGASWAPEPGFAPPPAPPCRHTERRARYPTKPKRSRRKPKPLRDGRRYRSAAAPGNDRDRKST